jgi:hypothetical protein
LVIIASNKALDQAADAQGVPQVDSGMPSDYQSIMNNTLFKVIYIFITIFFSKII